MCQKHSYEHPRPHPIRGKVLLVMDDVWSVTVWNDVLSVPVRNASQKQPGSLVLVTTRMEEIARRMEDIARRMGATFYQHRVSPLDMDDAWSLLKKQLPPHREPWCGAQSSEYTSHQKCQTI